MVGRCVTRVTLGRDFSPRPKSFLAMSPWPPHPDAVSTQGPIVVSEPNPHGVLVCRQFVPEAKAMQVVNVYQPVQQLSGGAAPAFNELSRLKHDAKGR